MPCGCQKAAAGSPSPEHVYVDAAGKQTVYPTKVQAMAAKIRAGNAGTVRPR